MDDKLYTLYSVLLSSVRNQSPGHVLMKQPLNHLKSLHRKLKKAQCSITISTSINYLGQIQVNL